MKIEKLPFVIGKKREEVDYVLEDPPVPHPHNQYVLPKSQVSAQSLYLSGSMVHT